MHTNRDRAAGLEAIEQLTEIKKGLAALINQNGVSPAFIQLHERLYYQVFGAICSLQAKEKYFSVGDPVQLDLIETVKPSRGVPPFGNPLSPLYNLLSWR